jgi:hypothetical protein
MAYAGICDSDNLQPHTDAYFHSVSFDQIITYTQTGVGRVCPLATPSGNLSPTVVIPLSYTIPVNTPFRLIATGSDPDGESITYCWEEWDIAGIFSSGQTWDTQIPGVNAPIFRSFYPTATGTRLFPKLNDILGDSVTIGEIKAIYSRTLHFRCTVRDNHSGCGGVTHSVGTTTVIVDASGGTGFAITNPNKAGLVWAKNKMHTVVWNVSGSNTPNVNIYLSTDDGYSFTDTIAMHVPNTGSYYFAFPDWIINSPDTTQLNKVRLMVEGDGNIFFDINDHAFRIDTFDILEPLDTVTIIKLYNSLVIKDSYSGLYNIHFGLLSPINGYFTVSIFDIMGKLMKQIIFKKRAEVYEEYIDVSDLASGMYIIRFDLPDGVETRKFMKAKY